MSAYRLWMAVVKSELSICNLSALELKILGSITIDCHSGQFDPMTKAFLQMSGMLNARAKGRPIGRPHATAEDIPNLFLRHYPAYKKGSLNVSELARVCDLSRTTIYKYISLLES